MPPSSSPSSWDAVRTAYCDTTETVAAIAIRFKISRTAVYARARAEGWPRRSTNPGFVHASMDHARAARSPVNRIDPADPGPPAEGAAVPGAATQAAPTPAAASRKPPSPARNPTRASLVKRLYRALDLKLTQLETLMAATARSDTADHERQSRAMDAIVRAFKRVTEVDPDILKSVSLPGLTAGAADRPAAHRTGKPGSGSAPASAVDAASAELLRRDIAGRLGALLAKRDVPGNPG